MRRSTISYCTSITLRSWRAGGSGLVGTRSVIKAAPDGYTLFLGHTGSISINPSLYANANFGVLDIDWWERRLTLALRDEGGSTRRSAAIDFAEIGIAP